MSGDAPVAPDLAAGRRKSPRKSPRRSVHRHPMKTPVKSIDFTNGKLNMRTVKRCSKDGKTFYIKVGSTLKNGMGQWVRASKAEWIAFRTAMGNPPSISKKKAAPKKKRGRKPAKKTAAKKPRRASPSKRRRATPKRRTPKRK